MKKPNLPKATLNKLVSLLVAFTLLVGIFLLTDPHKVSLALLLVPFLLIGYLVYILASLTLELLPKARDKTGAIKRLIPLSISFLAVALLLLASLGQLTIRDGLLVTIFTIFFLVYANRADFLK